MRWPWTCRKQPVDPMPDDAREAAEARRRAEAALRAAKRLTPQIKEERDRSMRHGRVNHFSQLIAETFRGDR